MNVKKLFNSFDVSPTEINSTASLLILILFNLFKMIEKFLFIIILLKE